MAQVLLDRANNRRSSVKELLSNTFETVGNNNLVSVLSKLRRRKETSKTDPIHHSSKDQSLTPELSRENRTIDIINLDDSRSCDDPEYTLNEEDDLPSVDIIEEKKNDVKGFACTVCGHATSSSQRLREHLSRHTGIKHLECEICGKKFAWRYSYRSHMACIDRTDSFILVNVWPSRKSILRRHAEVAQTSCVFGTIVIA